jgi:hypothetical protein
MAAHNGILLIEAALGIGITTAVVTMTRFLLDF